MILKRTFDPDKTKMNKNKWKTKTKKNYGALDKQYRVAAMFLWVVTTNKVTILKSGLYPSETTFMGKYWHSKPQSVH